jgi:hypothetical protein
MRMLPSYMVLVWMLAGAGAAGAADYDGIYRPNYAWAEGWDCRSVGTDGGAISIADGVLNGVENQCVLKNPVNIRGMDATLFNAECTGEGETDGYRLMILKTTDGLALIQNGSVIDLRRCE